MNDLLEAAWTIIANAGGGTWDRETAEWRNAAKGWRDEYFARLREQHKKAGQCGN